MGSAARYAAIAVAALAVAAVLALFPAQRQAQYAGAPNGYQGFAPNGVVSYNGHQDPAGDLMLDNGTTIRGAIWDGQYAGTIAQNHSGFDGIAYALPPFQLYCSEARE